MHESLSKPRHWAVMDEDPGNTMGSSVRPESRVGGVMKVAEASLEMGEAMMKQKVGQFQTFSDPYLEYTPWMTVTMLRSYSTQLEMPSLSCTWGLATCGHESGINC